MSQNLLIWSSNVYSIQIQCYFKNAHYMIFLLLHCFHTLSSKCPKGRFVALRFIYFYIDIFCWKNVRSFCIAVAFHIFPANNTGISVFGYVVCNYFKGFTTRLPCWANNALRHDTEPRIIFDYLFLHFFSNT